MIGYPIYIVNEHIDWHPISYNKNAIHLIEQNLDKISWYYLSNNTNAISIIEKI